MQDFQSIAGPSARIFPGVADGTAAGVWDNRRLRAYPSAPMPATPHLSPPPLKCPRCDSQNTKFCYYNNYNLSQPRHFCKSCRRYWTKGGVLRNVPVGGGCRKPKRSTNPKSRRSSATRNPLDRSNPLLDSSSSSNPNPANPSFDQPFAAEIFPDGAGGFSNLMADQSIHGFSFVDPTLLRLPDPHRDVGEIPAQDIVNQMVSGRGDDSAIEWPEAMDAGVYELAGGGDAAAYWSQSQWGDGDTSLYLP